MSDKGDGDGLEEMPDTIAEDDIAEVIELDDNGVVADELGDVEINDGDDIEEEEMGASGGDVVKDVSDLVFQGHTDAVFTVALDARTCDLAITGGQDDKAVVWKISTGEVILECAGHNDSVTCTGFSYDGTYVATADLSGLVIIWQLDKREAIWSFECSDAEWMKWHPAANVLLLGTVDGDTWMWKIPSGDCKTFQGPGCAASCGMVLGDGKRACIGYDDGSVRIWDLKGGNALHTVAGHGAHKSTVICLDAHPENGLVMSGSTDVTANVINSNTGKILGTFDCTTKNSSTDPADDSVEAVGFCPVQHYGATGTVAGVLSIWDMNTQTCRHKCKHEAGIVGLQWDRLSPLVYTACLDGVVRLWDSRSGELASQWSGHTDAILGFDITRDGNSLVTVSEDRTARVFSLHSPER